MKSNKYFNKKVIVDGIKFDSKKEAQRYKILKMLEKKGEIIKLVRQPKFTLIDSLRLPDGTMQRKASYIADFAYFTKDGKYIVEDVKSEYTRKDKTYRLKKKLMYAKYKIVVQEV